MRLRLADQAWRAAAGLGAGLIASCPLSVAGADDRFAPLLKESRPLETRWQTEYRGSLALGLGYTSTDNFMAGQYNGLSSSGPNLLGDLEWRQFSGGDAYWQLSLSDLGLATREGELRWGLPGRLSISVGFDSQQQVRNDSGRTPFAGDDILTLPGNWVSGLQTRDWSSLAQALQPLDRELERNDLYLVLDTHLNERWQLESSLRYRTRKGTGDIGAAIYTDASAGDAVLLPRPVDHRNLEADLRLGYSGKRLHMQGVLAWTDFNNRNAGLTWQNPYSSFGPRVRYPVGRGALALAPDSQQVSARFSGHYVFTPRLRAHFDSSLAVAEQNEVLLDYSANSALMAPQPLPRDSLDGDVTTSQARARLQWRAASRLDLTLGYRLRDRDYGVPRDGYRYLRGDGGDQPGAGLTVYNRRYDLRSQSVELEGAYRPHRRGRLTAGYEHEWIQRRNAATQETVEDRYSLEYRVRPWPFLSAKLGLLLADRAADTYHWDQSYFALLDAALINDTPDNQRYSNHPLLSQYYLANREQRQLRLDLNYLPDPRWNIGVHLLWREDDFDQTTLGVNQTELHSLQLSASFLPGDDLRINLHAGFDRYAADQGSRAFRGGQEKNAFAVQPPLPQASDPSRNWFLSNRDDSLVLGGQVAWNPHERLEFDVDYRFVDTQASQDFSVAQARDLDPGHLPDVDTRLHQLDASGLWHWREAVSFRVQYRYYRFQGNDWAWRGVAPDTIDKVLTFGQRNPNEAVHYAGLSVLYRW